jgi:hypothetical protein
MQSRAQQRIRGVASVCCGGVEQWLGGDTVPSEAWHEAPVRVHSGGQRVITGLSHCCRGDLEAPLGERNLRQVEEGQPRATLDVSESAEESNLLAIAGQFNWN